MPSVAIPKKQLPPKQKSMLTVIFEKYGFIVVLIIFMLIFNIFNPKLLTGRNILNIAVQVSPVGFLALGTMLVLISGGIDLTAGIGVSLAAMTVQTVYVLSGSFLFAIILSFLVVIALGAANGFLSSKLEIPPVIATLVMMMVVQGIVFILTKIGKSVNLGNDFFYFLARERLFHIPVSFLILIAFYIAGYIFINYSKSGFHLLAIGNSEEGARIAGINIKTGRYIPFILSGFCMGMTSIILIARVSFITPTIGGTSLLLDAIAAVIIGGVAISGGKGTIQGVFIGVIAITVINNIITLIDIHPAWNEFFKGLVIVIMVLFNRVVEVSEEKS